MQKLGHLLDVVQTHTQQAFQLRPALKRVQMLAAHLATVLALGIKQPPQPPHNVLVPEKKGDF